MDATQVADVFGVMAAVAVAAVVIGGVASLVHGPTRRTVGELAAVRRPSGSRARARGAPRPRRAGRLTARRA